jgi:hypothetical protein
MSTSAPQAQEHPHSPESTIAAESKLVDSSPFDEELEDVSPHFPRSPTLISGQVVESPFAQHNRFAQQEHKYNDSLSVGSNESISDDESKNFLPITKSDAFVSSDEDEAARGVLSDLLTAHQAAAVEDSEASSAFFGDEEEDEFAAMLNYQDSESEDEDATVATIRQDKEGSLLGAMASHRLSYGESTTASSAAPSIETVRQRRQSSIGTAPKGAAVLPFREEAPVKPNEQNHRAPVGALCLSPMQRTPMQARKWRALAVAAQEKDSKKKSNRGRKSLSERSINVLR